MERDFNLRNSEVPEVVCSGRVGEALPLRYRGAAPAIEHTAIKGLRYPLIKDEATSSGFTSPMPVERRGSYRECIDDPYRSCGQREVCSEI